MKITADMFDFNRYQYEIRPVRAGEDMFDPASRKWEQSHARIDNCFVRTEKPRPTLLLEGERILVGDERWDDGMKWWCQVDGRVGDTVRSVEVWRRMP